MLLSGYTWKCFYSDFRQEINCLRGTFWTRIRFNRNLHADSRLKGSLEMSRSIFVAQQHSLTVKIMMELTVIQNYIEKNDIHIINLQPINFNNTHRTYNVNIIQSIHNGPNQPFFLLVALFHINSTSAVLMM